MKKKGERKSGDNRVVAWSSFLRNAVIIIDRAYRSLFARARTSPADRSCQRRDYSREREEKERGGGGGRLVVQKSTAVKTLRECGRLGTWKASLAFEILLRAAHYPVRARVRRVHVDVHVLSRVSSNKTPPRGREKEKKRRRGRDAGYRASVKEKRKRKKEEHERKRERWKGDGTKN